MRSNAKGLIKYGAHWLLLAVNSAGITGAMLEVLEIPWQEFPAGGDVVLFGALFCFCGIGALFRLGRNGKRLLAVICCIGIVYLSLGLLWREGLVEGGRLALENAVANLNERYSFHIRWPASNFLRESAAVRSLAMIGSILYVLFPLELLAGFAGRYDRGFGLILGNGLWLAAACVCDIFPGYFFLTLCVLGAVGTLTQKDFGENPAAGAWVAVGGMTLAGLVMAVSYSVILPVLDAQYEASEEIRAKFYRLVNEEWIPRGRSLLAGSGGFGVDVTGRLSRSDLFTYRGADAYGVTVDRKPQGTLYLKGFVGETYTREAWEVFPDQRMEDYYEEAGMELPDHYGQLVNIGYEAGGALVQWEEPGTVSIQELGGRGSYSIYPYGAWLSEEELVHGDGSVERREAEYGFSYYFLSGFARGHTLPAKTKRLESEYRRYVYDSYLEYPKEQLPLLTKQLEQVEIRRDNVYACITDLMEFLDSAAVYNLDAENSPPDRDFVEYFLFESHEGYCMHFASAAVLSLRYFGIPARYVTGYAVSPSAFSEDGNGAYKAVLTGKQAHAWAEIYLDHIGWVPVEMTPGAVAFSEDNRMETAAQIGQLTGQNLIMAGNEDAWRQDKTQWQPETPKQENPEWEASAPDPEDFEEQIPAAVQERVWGEAEAKEREEDPSGTYGVQQDSQEQPAMLLPAGLAAAVLALGLGGWHRTVRRRREAFQKAGVREKVFFLYGDMRRALHIAGCPKQMAVDGEGFFGILEKRFSVDEEEYTVFCNALEKNSFSREELSGEEFQRVYAMCSRLVSRAWEGAPFYKKLLMGRIQRDMVRGEKDAGSRIEQDKFRV